MLSEIAEKIVKRGESTYLVPSFTDASLQYCVDMELGICNCDVGNDGSPYKHQYVVWKNHLSSSNFVPYFSQAERKLCSYIAIGEALPDAYYESLRDYLIPDTNNSNVNERSDM